MALAKITVHSTAKFTKHVETASEAQESEVHGMEMMSLAPEKCSGGQIDNHTKPKNLNFFQIRKRSLNAITIIIREHL